MKKIPAFALLVSLSALSSCQSIITREDACQILHEAASAVRAESFQLPRKVSFSSLYSRQFEKDLGTTNEKKEELITSLRVEFDEEAGKFFVGNYERHAETDRTYSRGVYYWLWKEDGKNHWVASNSEVDFARAEIEELDDESFAKRFQDLRETYIFDKETLAQDYEYVIET
ncbi:MAG: hypothetical protein J5736_01540, partial [Bacilli bacterium]|nr:hypothetical protein [Bacilli bacterium]